MQNSRKLEDGGCIYSIKYNGKPECTIIHRHHENGRNIKITFLWGKEYDDTPIGTPIYAHVDTDGELLVTSKRPLEYL